jgi:hypothetical protein
VVFVPEKIAVEREKGLQKELKTVAKVCFCKFRTGMKSGEFLQIFKELKRKAGIGKSKDKNPPVRTSGYFTERPEFA